MYIKNFDKREAKGKRKFYYLGAIFTMIFSMFSVFQRTMSDQTGFVGVRLRTQIATVLIPAVVVLDNQVLVKSGMERHIKNTEIKY